MGPELVIHNGLFVPNFNCNLISILQLLKYNPECWVYFSKFFCVIQHRMLRKEIGLGKLVHRVYNFSHEQATPHFFLSIYIYNICLFLFRDNFMVFPMLCIPLFMTVFFLFNPNNRGLFFL